MRANIQNVAFLLEVEERIIDLRANGSLSPFYLSYFSGMEPSSPFLNKMIFEIIYADI